MLYFAYGSNMWQPRIEERLGACRRVTPAWIDGYALRFHKDGRDGSGKCNALFTGRPEDRLWGVVFDISASQKRRLDVFEGRDYHAVDVAAQHDAGALDVYLYVARRSAIDALSRPFEWYKALVLHGARVNQFPEAYLAAIERVPATEDPDRERHATHMKLIASAD